MTVKPNAPPVIGTSNNPFSVVAGARTAQVNAA